MDIRNFHQTPEDIIKAATPEQKILWNHIFLIGGERCTVSQYCYTGLVGGTEMNVYRARRIYLAYQLIKDSSVGVAAGDIYLGFFDETNTEFLRINHASWYWNATTAAAANYQNTIILNNLYFSRFSGNASQRINFIGYRITY